MSPTGIKVPVYGRSIKQGDTVLLRGKLVTLGARREPNHMSDRFGWEVFDVTYDSAGTSIVEAVIYRDREYEIIQEVGK